MAARSCTDTSYARKASSDLPSSQPIGGKPIFIKHKDIPSVNENTLTNQEVYKCLLSSVQGREIKGVQKIGGLWRLYIESQNSRIKLITNGINMRNANVTVYDTNPFLSAGKENSLRLVIRDIPLSAHDTLIADELDKLNCKILGPIIYQRLRVDGQLTDCFTGDRVVYIQPPPKPLPRFLTFGPFKGKIFHFGQIPSTQRSTVVCSRCLSEGHHRSLCSNPVVCRRCKQPGHLQMQCLFDATPTSQSSSFDSHVEDRTAATASPAEQAIDKLLASKRQASSLHHDNQTPSQAKITQYLIGDRDRSTAMRDPATTVTLTTHGSNATVLSADVSDAPDHDTRGVFRSHSTIATDDSSSDVTLSEDDVTVHELSELSAESPVLPKHTTKTKSAIVKQKRKQKSLQKLPKKK
ncbi:uncharacterized protein LOC121430923 [Lytechinus variegatus]|uniref:uncharacterized protein LOC121430923 n=1 Tax=Lytechinus variegatus TaxID=7654 RepID=UPI001BB21166|nr:uncharacterized protein LOC121430923 [Lytechinus variegatus]